MESRHEKGSSNQQPATSNQQPATRENESGGHELRALRNWLERDFHGITAPVLKRLTTLIPRQLPASFDRPPRSAEDLLHDCLLRSLARCDDQRVRTRGDTTALLQGFARNVLRNQRKRARVRRRIAARLEASVSAR